VRALSLAWILFAAVCPSIGQSLLDLQRGMMGAADSGYLTDRWYLEVTTTTTGQYFQVNADSATDLIIEWGDGNESTFSGTSFATNQYASAGVWEVTIRGAATRVRFNQVAAPRQRLTAILTPVRGITGITSFQSTFRECVNLQTAPPADLFAAYPSVTTFAEVFRGSGIPSVPEGLFAANTNVTSYSQAFFGTPVTSVPETLFANSPKVTSFSFLLRESQLASIPAGLFSGNPLATDFSFAFQQTKITEVPAGLFDSRPTTLVNFNSTFQNCTNLTTVPANLFAWAWNSQPAFTDTFSGCGKLVMRGDIFGSDIQTAFGGKTGTAAFAGFFARPASPTGLGTAPALWTVTNATFTSTGAFTGNSTNTLTNWESIPTAWGGP